MKKLLKRITSVFLALILVTVVSPACSFAEGNDEHPAGALKILAVVEGVDTGFENDMFFWELAPALNDQTTFYESSHWFFGVGQMCVMAVPYNDTATVNMYATTSRNNNFSEYYEEISGKVKVDRSPKTYVDGNSYPIFVYWPMTNIYTCAIRIEVIDGDVTRNYDLVCKGVDSTDPVAELKAGFNITLEQTPASSFTTSARGIVETAKPIFKSMMEQATTEQEACRIANQFNMIVCSAKSIEDEITTLNDAVHDADTALAGITAAVNTGAVDAVTEAEELNLTEFSEEDAAAVTTALADLKEVLADDTATAEEILNAKEALEEAVYTAKINAQDTQIDQLKEDHRKDVEENERLRAQLAEITEAKGNAEKKLEETEAELAEVKQFIIDDSMNKILDRTEQYLDSAKEELAKAAEELKKEAGSAAESVLKKIFAAAGDAVRSATAGLEQINGTLGKGADRVNALKEQLGDLAKTIKEGAASEAELNDLRSQLEDAEEELAKARETAADADGLSAELEALRAELAKANEKLAKATKPGKVTIRSAKAGKKKVTVKWDARTDADGYVVFRSLKKSKGFKAVKTIKKAKTVKFVDKKVKKGKKYFYKVCAYKNYDGNKLNGQFSKVLKTKKVK